MALPVSSTATDAPQFPPPPVQPEQPPPQTPSNAIIPQASPLSSVSMSQSPVSPQPPAYFIVPSMSGTAPALQYSLIPQPLSAPPDTSTPVPGHPQQQIDPVFVQFGVGGVAAVPSPSLGVFPVVPPSQNFDVTATVGPAKRDGESSRAGQCKAPRLGTPQQLTHVEDKVQRRLVQNREAAKRCRQRKMQYVKKLEEEVEALQRRLGINADGSSVTAQVGTAPGQDESTGVRLKQLELAETIRQSTNIEGMEDKLRGAIAGLLEIESDLIGQRQKACKEGKWNSVAGGALTLASNHLTLWLGGWKPSTVLSSALRKLRSSQTAGYSKDAAVLEGLIDQSEAKERELEDVYESTKSTVLLSVGWCMPIPPLLDHAVSHGEVGGSGSGSGAGEQKPAINVISRQTSQTSVGVTSCSSGGELWGEGFSQQELPTVGGEQSSVEVGKEKAIEMQEAIKRAWDGAVEPQRQNFARVFQTMSQALISADQLRGEILSQAQQNLSLPVLGSVVAMPVDVIQGMNSFRLHFQQSTSP